MKNIILEAKGLSKSYKDDTGKFLRANDNIDLVLYEGESLGIVGESGCGKSTLLKMITQLERPDQGQLFIRGKDVTHLKGEALRQSRKHLQMVFQDPASSFYPRMKAEDAVSEPLRNFQSLSKAELRERVENALELARLPKDFVNRYPHSMSGGQRQRLGIARALILDPEILVCDEATSALDVSVQGQIVDLLLEIQEKRNLSVIFVAHDLALLESFTHRIMVMYLGNIVEILPTEKVKDSSGHPYTRALLEAVFTVDMDPEVPLKLLEGEIPSALDLPSGCPFHTRCIYKQEVCQQEKPKLREIDQGHHIACHFSLF